MLQILIIFTIIINVFHNLTIICYVIHPIPKLIIKFFF